MTQTLRLMTFGRFGRVAVCVVLCLMSNTMFASASSPSSTPSHTPSYWHPWFEIAGYHNSRNDGSTGTTGTNRGETTIFAPIRGNERSLLFSQLTAKFFDNTAKEGNLAFGYRQMMPSGFNLGAWIGGDVRRTEIDNTFWQLSGGFEALSKNIDVRVNWYGPVTKPQTGVAGFAQVHLQGNQIYMTGGEEVGLMGVDGEVGFRVPTEAIALDPNLFELRAYAGGYHFTSDDAEDNVTGVKGRLELRFNDVIAALPGSRLTVDYEVSHDDVRETRHDVGLRMRIPLNGGEPARALASLSHQQRRMLDGIERDTDIITGRSKREGVEDALTGADFESVAYANATASVTAASNAAGDNALIIVNGEVQGAQTLQGNQTLQGGGATIQVRGRKSGLAVPFTAPGVAGSLTTPVSYENNLTLEGSNTHVAGIMIVGKVFSGDGVSAGDNHSNVYLSDLTIQDVGKDAVHFGDGNTNIWMRNLQVSNTNDYAVGLGSNNTGIWISNLQSTGVGDAGVFFYSGNIVSIDGGLIAGIGYGVIAANDGNTLSIVGTRFANLSDAVVRANGRMNSIALSEITVTDAGFVFYITNGDGSDLLLRNSTFNGAIRNSWFTSYAFGSGVGPQSVNIEAGSTGNINNTGVAPTCRAIRTGSFTGSEIDFTNGDVIDPSSC